MEIKDVHAKKMRIDSWMRVLELLLCAFVAVRAFDLEDYFGNSLILFGNNETSSNFTARHAYAEAASHYLAYLGTFTARENNSTDAYCTAFPAGLKLWCLNRSDERLPNKLADEYVAARLFPDWDVSKFIHPEDVAGLYRENRDSWY